MANNAGFAAAAALSFAAIVAPFPVSAQAPQIPIEIKTCAILPSDPVTTVRPWWYPFGPVIAVGAPVADGIRIAYVNHGPSAANRVAFVVNYRGDVQRIIDVGTFAPNVTIDHTFGNFSGDAFLGANPNACTVAAVRYADGSVWRASP